MSALEILGVRVDNVSYEEFLSTVDTFVAAGRPHQIVTLNPEMLVSAHDDGAFRSLLNASDLNVADGAGVILAARLLGRPLRQRITGSDGIYCLAAHSAQRGYRLFLLGAAPGVAEAAAARLVTAYPALRIAGTFAGSPGPPDEAEILTRVAAAAPDILLVAYGVPAEEKWIARNRERLGVPVMMGVGGALDFAAGVTRRAPAWLRSLGFEWLYRLLIQPWRWRRQLALPRFVELVIIQKIRGIGAHGRK